MMLVLLRSNYLYMHYWRLYRRIGFVIYGLISRLANIESLLAICQVVSQSLSSVNFHRNYCIYGLVQDCIACIANALDLLQSCTKPSVQWSIHCNLQTM